MLKGLALLLGGLLWATLHLIEWRRWRAGKPARLPWHGWVVTDAPRTEMNRMTEAAGMAGNVLLGLAMVGLGSAIAYAG
ncbi:MAG: hypothetical protein U9R07_17555 [Pseudomonadota bacterium]|nr:hypothetical protein [Pseudomonadota bacterium]